MIGKYSPVTWHGMSFIRTFLPCVGSRHSGKGLIAIWFWIIIEENNFDEFWEEKYTQQDSHPVNEDRWPRLAVRYTVYSVISIQAALGTTHKDTSILQIPYNSNRLLEARRLLNQPVSRAGMIL